MLLMIAIQSSIVMLPISILVSMVFRNIRPRPTEQRLIKDLLVYDEYGTYGDMVEMYEARTTEIDNETYKSLSVGSLPTHDSPDKPADDKQQDVESSSLSSSSASSSTESDGPPSQDEFVTPQEPTEPVTPADETASRASKPEMTADNQTDFSTAIEGDIDTFVGLLPWWVTGITWILAILGSIACGFFIILYTFTFGPEKTKAWCASVLTSFFFGLLLEQPIKILLVAFALAFICRKATDIYPTELDIVADHSVRGTYVQLSQLAVSHVRLSVCLFYS